MRSPEEISPATRALRHRIQTFGGWLRLAIAAGGLTTGLIVEVGMGRVNCAASIFLLVSIVYVVLLRRGPLPRSVLLFSLAFDALAATHVILAFGPSRTLLVALYLPLLLGYTVMSRGLGRTALATTVLAYGAALLLEVYDLIPGIVLAPYRSDALTQPALLLGNWFVFFGLQAGIYALTRLTVMEAERYAETQRELRESREAERLAQIRRQVAESQRLEALGHLACGVAHDFNNILTVILGYGTQLQRQFEPGTRPHRQATELIASAERAATLTTQLLAFGKSRVAEPRATDLNAVAADLRAMLKRTVSDQIDLRLSLDAEQAIVTIDPQHLQQAVANLVVNACDALRDGGVVEILTGDGAALEPLDGVPADLEPSDCVVLSVKDEGIGMDEATKARVFDPFFTTKKGGHGTGLGLSMAYGTVRQAGGHIEVASKPDEGTTLRIWLPLESGDAAAPHDDAAAV